MREINTKEGKRWFIEELMGSFTKTLMDNVDKMPDEWDGIELRQYIADKANEQIIFGTMDKRRRKDYENEVIVRNL